MKGERARGRPRSGLPVTLEPGEALDVALHGRPGGSRGRPGSRAGARSPVPALAVRARIRVEPLDDRRSSSIAPPRRCRYCCANSGPCEADDRADQAKAEGGGADDAGHARPPSFRRKEPRGRLVPSHVHERLRNLVGARLAPRLHDEDHGLGPGQDGSVQAISLTASTCRPAAQRRRAPRSFTRAIASGSGDLRRSIVAGTGRSARSSGRQRQDAGLPVRAAEGEALPGRLVPGERRDPAAGRPGAREARRRRSGGRAGCMPSS